MKQEKNKGCVAVALSGGVDSTAAAIHLMDEGYTCFGITMYLFDLPDENGIMKPPSFLKDAGRVAEELGIEHHIIDMRDVFKEKIMLPFAKAYLSGETPNPCVLCNREIKYGLLLEEAVKLGADYMATGHYARNIFNPATGQYQLFKGLADRKDQAYVMHGLTQKQLSRILFPNGSYMSKEDIREVVAKWGIFTASKKDSMGICFVPHGDYGAVIKDLFPGTIEEGNFVDLDGNVLGRHRGIVYYTVGQKRGLGIETTEPMTVIEIDSKRNQIVLGPDEKTYSKAIVTDTFHLISEMKSKIPDRVQLKMFNWGLMLDAWTEELENGQVKFIFEKPERAPACGQHAVIYNDEQLLGGGKIVAIVK
ncbi:tRNA 2-thiouridine(34) synthase MnmA [Fusibacter sp. JL216-2]|uniref:tRNA 2-thiouridine(34) synthase MnmA n=1 Tax=Fusibacter sp. JL216-2 TaxID=3071453 RepID=UPI003D352EE5